ncbi:MAG: tetratricopeptide repeat protein, partial [Bacteroidota bacterium]
MEYVLNVPPVDAIKKRKQSLKLFLYIVCLAFMSISAAQAQPYIKRIPSIDSLNDRAWNVVQNDISAFKQLGGQALVLSNKQNYLFGQCEALQIIGTYYRHVGEPDSAYFWYNEALKARVKLGDSAMISGTLSNLSVLFMEQGNYLAAKKNFENAEKLIPASDIVRRANLQSNLVVLNKRMGNYDEALTHVHQVKQLLQESMDSILYATCLMNEGNLYELMGEQEKAIENHNEALEIFKSAGDSLNQAKVLNNLGNAFLRKSDFGQAMRYFESSLKMFQKQKSLMEIAGIEQNISTLHRYMGNLEDAKVILKRSLDKWDQIDNQEKKAEGLILMGEILFEQKRYRQAINVSIQAEEIIPANSANNYILLYNLSRYHSLLGEYDKAYEYQKRSNILQEKRNAERFKWSSLEKNYRFQIKEVEFLNKENQLLYENTRKEKHLRFAILIG